jgi:hypothetical protein
LFRVLAWATFVAREKLPMSLFTHPGIYISRQSRAI